MESKGWTHFTMQLAPVDPQREFPRTDPGFHQVFTAHVSREGHARGLPILRVPIFGHTYTHMLGTHVCMFPTVDDAPVVFFRRNPRQRGPEIYPYSFLRKRPRRWIFCFILVCLGHIYMESKCWAHFTMQLAPVDP
jgi:hypothetical protein